MKTSELIDHALDWAVAKAIGHLDAGRVVVDLVYLSGEEPVRWEPRLDTYYSSAYSPSTSWRDGGPIIEQANIALLPGGDWGAVMNLASRNPTHHGPTPLIAAMRCFVASRLGDTVNIPEELV